MRPGRIRLPRLRRPRFALVLVAFLAPVAVVLALTAHKNSAPATPPPLIASGPAHACVTAHASATGTAIATGSASATASVPVTVTETVRTKRAIVSATRSETVVETARAQRTVSVRQIVSLAHRSCARASTIDAARSIALQRAYAIALKHARPRALAAARKHVGALLAQVQPGLQAEAQTLADNRASAAAAAARLTLAHQALADARAHASKA